MSANADGDSCLGPLIVILVVIVVAILTGMTLNRIDDQENWIRDLQRRVAILEQERK